MTDHPRLTTLLALLDTHRAELEESVALVPPSHRERRPADESWSVAEVLEHLAIVEGGITRLLGSLLEQAHAPVAAEGEASPEMASIDIARVLDRSWKVTAGEASLPREGLDWEAAWTRLVSRRDALRALLVSDGDALGRITALHPVFGTLDGYGWVEFIAAHEGRHARQVREIGERIS